MSETIKLDRTPKRLVGEVSSSIRWVTVGVEPLGALFGGCAASWLGAGPWLAVAGFGLASAAVWVFLIGGLREVDLASLNA